MTVISSPHPEAFVLRSKTGSSYLGCFVQDAEECLQIRRATSWVELSGGDTPPLAAEGEREAVTNVSTSCLLTPSCLWGQSQIPKPMEGWLSKFRQARGEGQRALWSIRPPRCEFVLGLPLVDGGSLEATDMHTWANWDLEKIVLFF